MTFMQVRQAVLSGDHQHAYLKFKRTIVRISKAYSPNVQTYQYAKPGGLVWEINQKKNNNVFDYSGWEEIRQQASYMCRDDWEFHDHP